VAFWAHVISNVTGIWEDVAEGCYDSDWRKLLHSAFVISENSKMSSLLLISNCWTHVRCDRLEQNITDVYFIDAVFICNCLLCLCSK
jgi:hypothetical protein